MTIRLIQSVDDPKLLPTTKALVAFLRAIDAAYGNELHQLLFIERMDEAQRRWPCPGGKATCMHGFHTTGGKLIDIGNNKKRAESCYDMSRGGPFERMRDEQMRQRGLK